MNDAVSGGVRFYIGWDVGGWNCDKNATSRDAIVILDAGLNVVGKPWRGNLRKQINESKDSAAWIGALFGLCGIDAPSISAPVTLAIDTPLGFSNEFAALITQHEGVTELVESSSNPYLFRKTERWLFERGLTPLSAVKDMIGSQATKGMHVVARFARQVASCGVWSDGQRLTVLEAYPSPCRKSATIQTLRTQFAALGHADQDDALICALVAYLYTERRDTLVEPGEEIPITEGWIWLPRDVVDKREQ